MGNIGMLELSAAHSGLTVLYVTDGMAEVRGTLEAVRDDSDPDVASIRFANGAEQIRYKSGGRVVFRSPRGNGSRGISADVVSVSAATFANDDVMASLWPCMATSKNARLVIR